ncbi:MAG: hypothetical protein ACLFVW_02130 [Phycisphaerae bacterium]
MDKTRRGVGTAAVSALAHGGVFRMNSPRQGNSGFSETILQSWGWTLLLPTAMAACALFGSFFLPAGYRAVTDVVLIDRSTGDTEFAMPFVDPELSTRFFRNKSVADDLIDSFGLDAEPHHILGNILSVKPLREASMQPTQAAEVAVTHKDPSRAEEMVAFVIDAGLTNYQRWCDEHHRELEDYVKTADRSARERLDKARIERRDFAKEAGLDEMRERLKAQQELSTWRMTTKQLQETELTALEAGQEQLEAIVADEPASVELKRLLAQNDLLREAMLPASSIGKVDTLPLSLTVTKINPAHYHARSLLIDTRSRRRYLQGHLEAIAEADTASENTVSRLSAALEEKQARLEELDFLLEQAREGAWKAQRRVTRFEQMLWPPQQLKALSPVVYRQSQAKKRVFIAIGTFLVAFMVSAGVLLLRLRNGSKSQVSQVAPERSSAQ